ncbi:MAG TPA: hypothetical protein VGM92_10170 [Candidatus Kapabacteria bacterium]
MFNRDFQRAEVLGMKGFTAKDAGAKPIVAIDKAAEGCSKCPEYDSHSRCLDSIEGFDSVQFPSTSFWKDENRPRLLLAGGVGFNSLYSPSQVSFGTGHLDYAFGLGYRHKIEGLFRNAFEYQLGLTAGNSIQYDAQAWIHSCALWIYPWKDLFVEGGFSLIDITADSAFYYPTMGSSATKSWPPSNASLTALSAGLGWSGDFYYLEWYYEFGLKPTNCSISRRASSGNLL